MNDRTCEKSKKRIVFTKVRKFEMEKCHFAFNFSRGGFGVSFGVMIGFGCKLNNIRGFVPLVQTPNLPFGGTFTEGKLALSKNHNL